MVVGVCVVELYIPQSGSLKAKRQVVRSMIAKIKSRFNVSISEIGDLDLWQKAILGVAAVANDKGFVNEVMDKVLNLIASHPEVEVVGHRLEFI